MPSLVYRDAGQQKFKAVNLFKAVTSVGAGRDNDVVVRDPKVVEHHALIHFDGKSFTLQAVDRKCEVQVNGKRLKKRVLSHGDEVVLGTTTFTFGLIEDRKTSDPGQGESALRELRKLQEFSAQLLDSYDLPTLLNALMDAIIVVSGADKGMLILAEGERFVVKVARNLNREHIEDAVSQVSDSIIAKVVESKKPVIVSDALNDAQFNGSESIINLNLCSVMCLPLMDHGALIGLLYVGNDNIANLFTTSNLDSLTVFAAQASLLIANALLVNDLKHDNKALVERIESMRFGEIIGSSDAMREVFRRVEKVAATGVSVLVQGETGTGKELIAREIHERSDRASGPFITINCGAIPENLLESELFGHVRGAFTGATHNKPGKFHLADKGTIFLDEIGEMPLNLQVKILRVLQEKMVTRVGDTKSQPVDIRVVAATNRDLDSEVKKGKFREDLYYRLNVVTLNLPPLRNRGDDISLIANYLLARYCGEFGCGAKTLASDALIAMKKYAWPGNIRQLENRLKKGVILSDKSVLAAADLDLQPEDLEEIMTLGEAKEAFQRRYINEVLARNNNNRTKTARDLGVDPRTIFRHLEKEAGEGD